MDILPPNVTRLIEEFAKLPSIGPKSAERLTFYLLKYGDPESLGQAILGLKEGIVRCQVCRNFSSQYICPICTHPSRDKAQIAVVSQPLDVAALEKTSQFSGVYHVLHGVISPVDGMGPDSLEIESLMARISQDKPSEVVLALNPNIEGETTALFLAKKISPIGIKVTRLAHGLPIGGDLEYADQLTLARALVGRREMD